MIVITFYVIFVYKLIHPNLYLNILVFPAHTRVPTPELSDSIHAVSSLGMLHLDGGQLLRFGSLPSNCGTIVVQQDAFGVVPAAEHAEGHRTVDHTILRFCISIAAFSQQSSKF